jgi:hypothetical protein
MPYSFVSLSGCGQAANKVCQCVFPSVIQDLGVEMELSNVCELYESCVCERERERESVCVSEILIMRVLFMRSLAHVDQGTLVKGREREGELRRRLRGIRTRYPMRRSLLVGNSFAVFRKVSQPG